MIRSSKHHIKEANSNKKNLIFSSLLDYQILLQSHINYIISNKFIEGLSKPPSIPEIKHSQWLQVSYKQALEIVKSQLELTKNRVYKKYKKLYSKCTKKNTHKSFTSKRFKDLKIDLWHRLVTPELKNIVITLDQRLVDFQEGNNSFDEFIRIKLPYFRENKKRAITVNVPLKQHKQSLKFNDWNRKKSIGLSNIDGKLTITLFYEKEEVKKREGNVIGIDMGYKKLISSSDGRYYGIDLKKVYEDISRKIRGSKNYKQLLQQKKNLINLETKRFVNDHKDYGVFKIEELKNIKLGKSGKFINKMQYWSATQVASRLSMLSEEEGFLLLKVDPAYTSQTCSNCGCIDGRSRDRESFKCVKCGIEIDADFNASINISHRGEYNPSTSKTYKSIKF